MWGGGDGGREGQVLHSKTDMGLSGHPENLLLIRDSHGMYYRIIYLLVLAGPSFENSLCEHPEAQEEGERLLGDIPKRPKAGGQSVVLA